MHRHVWGRILLAALCLQPGCRRAQSPASDQLALDGAVTAIRASIQKWVELYNRGEDETIVSELYADDAVQMPPNEPIRNGKAEILNGYRKSRNVYLDVCESSVVEDIRISGNLAVARGNDSGYSVQKEGAPADGYSYKWTIVFVKQEDGAWKWINEIWNDNAPQDRSVGRPTLNKILLEMGIAFE